MHILEVATKVTALRECLAAFGAGKRPLSSVLSKMIAKVTAFLKDRTATTVSTLEVQFNSHGLGIAHLYSLVPVAGNALKRFRLRSEQGRLRGGLFRFLALFDVVSQKFGFFF